jgi:hypothetical protein
MAVRNVRRCRVLQYIVAPALALTPVGPVHSREAPTIAGADTTSAGSSSTSASNATSEGQSNELAPLSFSERQSYGCLVAGGSTIALMTLVDSNELILVFGATVAPTTPVATVLAVSGVVFASACAVGSLATPAIVRLWKYYYVGMHLPQTP